MIDTTNEKTRLNTLYQVSYHQDQSPADETAEQATCLQGLGPLITY